MNEDASFPLYTTVKGPGYQVHTLYNYFVLLCGFLLFIPMYWRSSRIVRKQIIVLIMGAAVPMMFNMFFWFGMIVDLTPFGFAMSGVVYVWGILRFNLLRFTPLALTQVFDTIRDGVILLDYEDQIVSYNSAAEGVLPELGLTKHYPAYVGAVLPSSPDLIERIRAASTGDERFPYHRFHANRRKHYHCSLSFIYDSGSVPVGKMLMFNDITELKDNETRLRENARQLSELNSFKDKLFTVVAHDIRDPIALLVELNRTARARSLPPPKPSMLTCSESFQGQVQSTFHLVENLLDWYRSQKGKVMFRPLGWNLQQVIRQSLSLAGAKAGMKQIRMTERIDEKLTVNADKEMLDLILRNLLSNAIKYTGIGGIIEIEPLRKVILSSYPVRDNGAGIDDKMAEMLRLDEPFFKAPITGDDTGNMRFGLVLTNEFVGIHGGSLWFDSVPGVGTTFFFTLPGSAGGRDAFDNGHGGEDSMKVILVDDEPVMHLILHKMLDKLPGVQVAGAFTDALSAASFLSENADIGLAFVDISMKGENGLEFAAKMEGSGSPMQVVFVTSHKDFALEAYELSVLDYLVKPVSQERLQRTVNRALANRQVFFSPSRQAPVSSEDSRRVVITALGDVTVSNEAGRVKWTSRKCTELFVYCCFTVAVVFLVRG